MPGARWIDFEWLTELIWYGAFQFAGFPALVALKGMLFVVSAIFFWKVLELYGVGIRGRGLALLTGTVALLPANDIRPDNFSLVLFSCIWWWMESRRLGYSLSASRKAGKGGGEGAHQQASSPLSCLPKGRRDLVRISLASFLIFALWANLHPGFLFGLAVMAVFAVGEWMARRSWALLAAVVAGALGSFVNPAGIGLYEVIRDHLRFMRELHAYLREWQPAVIGSPWFATFWALVLLCFLSILVSALTSNSSTPGMDSNTSLPGNKKGDREHNEGWRRFSIPIEHLIICPIVAVSAVDHNRAIMYFIVVAVPLCGLYLSRSWRALPEHLLSWRTPLMALAAAVLVIFVFRTVQPALAFSKNFLPKSAPEGAARFMLAERGELSGRKVLNPWQWGGYLGYRIFPAYKVFVDGRYIFHPFLEPLHIAVQSPEAYQDFLTRYKIDVVLDIRRRQFFEQTIDDSAGRKIIVLRPYYLRFLPRSEWALVYWDSQALLFVRRKAVAPKWLAEREFTVFRPDDFATAAVLAHRDASIRERMKREASTYLALNSSKPSDKNNIAELMDRILKAGAQTVTAER